jgi:hypothetical protein
LINNRPVYAISRVYRTDFYGFVECVFQSIHSPEDMLDTPPEDILIAFDEPNVVTVDSVKLELEARFPANHEYTTRIAETADKRDFCRSHKRSDDVNFFIVFRESVLREHYELPGRSRDATVVVAKQTGSCLAYTYDLPRDKTFFWENGCVFSKERNNDWNEYQYNSMYRIKLNPKRAAAAQDRYEKKQKLLAENGGSGTITLGELNCVTSSMRHQIGKAIDYQLAYSLYYPTNRYDAVEAFTTIQAVFAFVFGDKAHRQLDVFQSLFASWRSPARRKATIKAFYSSHHTPQLPKFFLWLDLESKQPKPKKRKLKPLNRAAHLCSTPIGFPSSKSADYHNLCYTLFENNGKEVLVKVAYDDSVSFRGKLQLEDTRYIRVGDQPVGYSVIGAIYSNPEEELLFQATKPVLEEEPCQNNTTTAASL